MVWKRNRSMRRRTVRGQPNYLWICSAGELAQQAGLTAWDAILQPGEWSGTPTEATCTLCRIVLQLYTSTTGVAGAAHGSNCCLTMGNASETAMSSTSDIDRPTEWPDFFAEQDRVLWTGRVEWDGNLINQNVLLPVQFSQLPEPVINLRVPRRLNPDDSIRLCVGGGFVQSETEAFVLTWFCRSLVRTGIR